MYGVRHTKGLYIDVPRCLYSFISLYFQPSSLFVSLHISSISLWIEAWALLLMAAATLAPPETDKLSKLRSAVSGLNQIRYFGCFAIKSGVKLFPFFVYLFLSASCFLQNPVVSFRSFSPIEFGSLATL